MTLYKMRHSGPFIVLFCMIILSFACEIITNGGGSKPHMNIDSLLGLIDGEPGAFQLTSEGGTMPYQWSIIEGALPDGFTLEGDRISSVGNLATGTTRSISPPFTLRARDSSDPNKRQVNL